MPSGHILIVDDEPETVTSLRELLANQTDFMVSSASDGQEAMERGKQVAQEAVESAKETARDSGQQQAAPDQLEADAFGYQHQRLGHDFGHGIYGSRSGGPQHEPTKTAKGSCES